MACEYRKLETRLDDDPDLGLVPRSLSPDQAKHGGPGERDYNLCKCCRDANKLTPRGYFVRWYESTERESTQRTYSTKDPKRAEALAKVRDRVADVDRWRRAARGKVDLASDLAQERPIPSIRDRDDEPYDGLELDERVAALSDFTEQSAGSGLRGTADPEFALGAPYDPSLHGAAELEASVADAAWEASRKEAFRSSWKRTGDIKNPELRHAAQARLVERWDPRMTLLPDKGTGQPTMYMTNPFAERQPTRNPYARSAAHSGVDEGLAGEPAWKRDALARHEAAVASFLREARGKLAQRGMPREEIRELTKLPDLNPSREIGRYEPLVPLYERVDHASRLVLDPAALPMGRAPSFGERIAALRRAARPTFLAPAAKLDEIAEAAFARQQAPIGIGELVARTQDETAVATRGPADFRVLAERVKERDAFQADARNADAAREFAQSWATALRRSTAAVQGSTKVFAKEIRAAFADPQAFQAAFKQLTDDQKRAALRMLRERPADFTREFATAFGRDFGSAGEFRAAPPPEPSAPEAVRIGWKMFRVTPPTDIESAAVLTASAGERYLDAVASRDATRRQAATGLDLPEGATLKDLHAACESRLTAADAAKTAALRQRDAVGAPTRVELERAFSSLHPTERSRMLAEMPGLAKMLPDRRELTRSAPSL